VRYLGPVDGHAGDWVGVDWDGGAGGRHDGSLAGRRYFAAAAERSASFARAAALSPGIALPDAIRLRYRVDDFTKEEQGAYARPSLPKTELLAWQRRNKLGT
jgi:dynactin complex subunit